MPMGKGTYGSTRGRPPMKKTKKKRIKAGSGEKMRKAGTKGRPTAAAFKQAAKTAKKPKKTRKA